MTFGFQRRSVLPLPAKVNGGNPAPPASGVGGDHRYLSLP